MRTRVVVQEQRQPPPREHQDHAVPRLSDGHAAAVCRRALPRKRREHHHRGHIRQPLQVHDRAAQDGRATSTSTAASPASRAWIASCGAPVAACDLRAGAAMVIAGLMAEGATEVEDIHYIERGYENFVGKLSALGADIALVDVPDER